MKINLKNGLGICAAVLSMALSGAERRGTVCFTFDDYGGENWVKANAIFKRYDARATFLVSGDITGEKARVMKELQTFGHTVGLHTIHHRNAIPVPADGGMQKYFDAEIAPQLEVCRKYGIKISAFAYPNNRHNQESDEFLFKHFNFLRAGWKKGVSAFISLDAIKEKMVLPGGGIGLYYKRSSDELKTLLTQAHEKNALIVFYSHKIEPQATGVHMPTELLEELLKHARELNMNIIGVGELTTLSRKSEQ